MKLLPVDPAKIPDLQSTSRGRVSYPILKQFMESGLPVALLDRTGVQQSLAGLYSCLNSYAKNHDLPVKVLSRSGQLYLVRLDIDGDGKPNPNWRADTARGQYKGTEEGDPVSIDDAVIEERFSHEKDNVTK